VAFTLPDCEFEARRIQFQAASFLASEIKAFRIHSERDSGTFASARSSNPLSSRESLTPINTCLDLVLGTLGLPGFLAIKYLMFYKKKACVKSYICSTFIAS
jgi:hypothetical protein